MKITPEIEERIHKLAEKFNASGQDMISYLDGLLYADYLTYWDYIHLDVLLNLQNPKTKIPDERIFITYHQITELYFKLCLQAIDDLNNKTERSSKIFIKYLKRLNSYFDNLIASFEIMVEGMDPEEFLKFRMALLPASGFQSAQYRKIEICSTDIINLIDAEKRKSISNTELVEQLFDNFYWKRGSTEVLSGTKTLTLKQFELKYTEEFIALAKEYKTKNLNYLYKNLPEDQQKDPNLIEHLKGYDIRANIKWPLMHFKSAVRYLQKEPEVIAATGGTNWQKYLPPKNQKILFFPQLWTQEEIENWGKKAMAEL